MSFIFSFIEDFKKEFSKIEWPSFTEVLKLTTLVVFLCLVMGAYLGIFDSAIGRILIRLGIF